MVSTSICGYSHVRTIEPSIVNNYALDNGKCADYRVKSMLILGVASFVQFFCSWDHAFSVLLIKGAILTFGEVS